MANETACVTGASGFIGAHLVAALLAEGATVHATVRDAGATAKTAHLTSLPGADTRLRLFSADLTAPPGAFDEAIAGCSVVYHSASSYAFDVKDPQRDLVDPAVQGTRSVLHSCAVAANAGSGLRRLVLTSSVAAITDHGERGRVYTGADWNERSNLRHLPYYYGKVLAEREAHEFFTAQPRTWDLVVVNPSVVLGPALSASPINTSVESFVVAPCRGGLPIISDVTVGLVDVRDVAATHLAAATKGAAGSRYICSATEVSFKDIVGTLASAGCTREKGYKLPTVDATGPIGGTIMQLVARLLPGDAGAMLRGLLGNPALYDNAPSVKELGITYRPWRETVIDTVQSQAKWGNLPSLE
ncbi:hypothetical protein MMPV_000436 [Pyropia vietnamensis]